MWALRRASSNFARNQGLMLSGTFFKLDPSGSCLENKLCNVEHCYSTLRFMQSKRAYSNLKVPCHGAHSFASQVGTNSGGEEENDLEDVFSELGMLEAVTSAKDSSSESKSDELISEPELSDDNDDIGVAPGNELSIDSEIDTGEELLQQKKSPSDLFRAIMKDQTQSVYSILDKYEANGKELGHPEISYAILGLRKRRMLVRALQLSEWLERNKRLDLVERDYASRLDVIAKLRGIQRAEEYFEKIPKSFMGEVVYRTLLVNCVYARDVKKAEEVFNKIKGQGFPMAMLSFACNQLLILYQRVDMKKIADVLRLMEEENVKPSSFTYRTLIEAKGKINDYVGMDLLLESMKAEDIEPDIGTKGVLAKYYAVRGMKEKAMALLNEMEGSNLEERRSVCHLLLLIYAELGMPDHVARIWKACESQPRMDDTMAVIKAWGRLKQIEKAEALFEHLSNRNYKLRSRHYSQLLQIYVDNKMLSKGKDLVKRMKDEGVRIGPMTWDALVSLYVEAGEVEKADSILHEAIKLSEGKRLKPMFTSYMTLLEQYATRGDVHNAEKIFYRIRQAGYSGHMRPFQALVRAYQNAKVPAYGIRDRLKADNIVPNRQFGTRLAQVDAFRKTFASALVD